MPWSMVELASSSCDSDKNSNWLLACIVELVSGPVTVFCFNLTFFSLVLRVSIHSFVEAKTHVYTLRGS